MDSFSDRVCGVWLAGMLRFGLRLWPLSGDIWSPWTRRESLLLEPHGNLLCLGSDASAIAFESYRRWLRAVSLGRKRAGVGAAAEADTHYVINDDVLHGLHDYVALPNTAALTQRLRHEWVLRRAFRPFVPQPDTTMCFLLPNPCEQQGGKNYLRNLQISNL